MAQSDDTYSNDRQEFTHHDFDEVNRYLERLADRHKARVTNLRADTWAIYMKWFAVLIVAAGLAIAMILWAYAALKEKPRPEIVVPPINVKVENERPSPSPNFQSVVREVQRKAGETTANGAPETVIDYVIFRNIPFVRANISEVTIGMHYPDSEAKVPDREWCYITSPNDDGTSTKVQLSVKRGSLKIESELTYQMARSVGLSMSDLTEAKNLCKFSH
jgi:hypothetical protein